MELNVRNVNEAFSRVFEELKTLDLEPEKTRNGPAVVFPGIVTTVYDRPDERVLFHAGRDANPIFHLMESIWMLAGRRDVAFLTQFNKRMSDFSDDGDTFNAAYGYRWRKHFGYDQLVQVIKVLIRDPKTRQAVVQIWDEQDLHLNTKDKACNTQVIFDTRGGALNMTVFNRSNDIWWGAYGANAVHFSFMQEFVASAIMFPLGKYRQVSNNFHLYTELYDAARHIATPPVQETYDLYVSGTVEPRRIMDNSDHVLFLEDCETFCADPFKDRRYYHSFFHSVARPMAMVSRVRKEKQSDGREYARSIAASDWSRAVLDWINRRENKKLSRVESTCLPGAVEYNNPHNAN